jgi:murein tripeptide amidase MpaA
LNAYIDSLVGQFDYVNVESIGRSGEGRDMRVLQITKAGAGAPNVWIEAGIHAREWISPAMSTYIIEQLLFHDTNNFIEELNFHILPSANPDGYAYTFSEVIFLKIPKTRPKSFSVI